MSQVFPGLPAELEAKILFLHALRPDVARWARSNYRFHHNLGKPAAEATAWTMHCLAEHLFEAGCCGERPPPLYDDSIEPYSRRRYGWHMGKLYTNFVYAERSVWLEPLDLAVNHGALLRAGHNVVVFCSHWEKPPRWCAAFTAEGWNDVEVWPAWKFRP